MNTQLTDLMKTFDFEKEINSLKPYQKNSITSLVAKYGEKETVKIWLAANGPSDTQKFGGEGDDNKQSLYDHFILELKLLICGDKKYEKDRDKLLTDIISPSIACIISGILAPVLGVTPVILVPVVVIIISIISKMGLNAWCACTDC